MCLDEFFVVVVAMVRRQEVMTVEHLIDFNNAINGNGALHLHSGGKARGRKGKKVKQSK